MLLGDTNTLVSKQDGNSLDWFSGQELIDSKRFAEAMRVSTRNFRQAEEPPQSRLPATYDAFEFFDSAPEKMFFSYSRGCLKCFQNHIRQNRIYRYAGLLGVKEQTGALDPVCT